MFYYRGRREYKKCTQIDRVYFCGSKSLTAGESSRKKKSNQIRNKNQLATIDRKMFGVYKRNKKKNTVSKGKEKNQYRKYVHIGLSYIFN